MKRATGGASADRFPQPQQTLGIGEAHVLVGTGTLVTLALGSCIGLCLYDAGAHVAGMVHVMLPSSKQANAGNANRPYVFADTGIAALRTQMLARGAGPTSMRAKVFGGASMFQSGGALLAVGKRNVLATRKAVWKWKLTVDVMDVGGTVARTIRMDVATGRIQVSKAGSKEWV